MTTEPKAKGVDVLSVMLDDAAAAYSYRRHLDADRGRSAKEDSAEARDAVAELIEAASALDKALSGEDANDENVVRAWIAQRKALKRIGGEV